jgi:hypothetical protein
LEAKVLVKVLPALRDFKSNSGSRGVEVVLGTFLKNLKRCLVQTASNDRVPFRLKARIS